jgi:putative ABC transport system permease protein
MTTLAHRAALGGPRNGGVAARRAVIRWTGRMFRREWRQQLLVVTLLTVAVAAAVGSVTTAYNTAPADDAEFGAASSLLRFDGGDPRKLAAGLAAAEKWFGTTDVIGHRSVAVPGGVETVDFRAQDPHGAYGRELLALRRGRYPAGAREVAVTDGVAELLRLHLGATLSLDGRRRTVVGIVENPRKLSDEFSLVSRASAGVPDHVTVLVDAKERSIHSFVQSLGERGESAFAFAGSETRPNQRAADTLAMFSVATVFVLLASLVAAASFAVVAQRRLRQLGMLAAVGATHKHVRLVLVAHGALVGAIAALLGTLAGLALWVAVAPTLESTVDHRVDGLSLPWGVIALTVLVAVLGAIAAAWWPGRMVARLPVVLALSGRPPKPRPARHAAIAAAALIATGIGCLALSDRDRPPLIVAGTVATIVGCLLLGPAAIRIFSGLAGRLSIGPRLALRDLVRHQARSGAALAAVTLALGIAATIVIVASAEQAKDAAEPPNLSDRQIRVYLGPAQVREIIPPDAAQRADRLGASVAQLAAQLDRAAVIPLRGAFQPGTTAMVIGGTGARGFPPVDLARRYPGPSYRAAAQLYVATPAVLRYLGIDPAGVAPGTDFLADRSVPTNQLVIPSFVDRREFPIANVQRIDVGRHLFGSNGAIPGRNVAFITLDGLRRRGWKQIPAGWLVEARRPLTSDQIADARERAADAGLTIEGKRETNAPTKAMAITTAAGALLALGILAMTVGLIRGESAGDLRTLTATGATSSIRRKLTATTAGSLALLGALLGVAGAYVLLLALYDDDLRYLSDVPVLYLALAVIGVPLAATAAGWLLSGREPPAIARTVIE